MSHQPSLFDTDTGPGAFGQPRETLPHCGKETSRAAAEAAEPRAGTWRAKVLEFIRSQGKNGATRDEAVEALRMNPNTLRPRWKELEEAGLIRNAGVTVRNANGLRVEVYVAAEVQP